jgi:hypothetical protein
VSIWKKLNGTACCAGIDNFLPDLAHLPGSSIEDVWVLPACAEVKMPVKNIDPSAIDAEEDWEGNNAAFRCPVCEKVFIVSDTRMHIGPTGEKGYRACPKCNKSIARVSGGRKSGGSASIEW